MTTPIRAHMTRAEGDGRFTFTFVTEGIKPDGLDLRVAGMRIDDYLTNPVVLWAHDYWGERLPIGKATGIKRFKTKAKARIQFDMTDPFAAQVARKYEDGFLNTVSVGWDILQIDDDRRTVTDWNVLDISAVPVPGDPKALVDRQKVALRALARDMVEGHHVDPAENHAVRVLLQDQDGTDDGEWLIPPGAVHIARDLEEDPLSVAVTSLLPTVREGEGLLAAAVALKDAAQQVIDSHEQEDDPDPPPADPPVGDPPVGDPPVVNPVVEVLKGLQEVLGTSEGTEGADDD